MPERVEARSTPQGVRRAGTRGRAERPRPSVSRRRQARAGESWGAAGIGSGAGARAPEEERAGAERPSDDEGRIKKRAA